MVLLVLALFLAMFAVVATNTSTYSSPRMKYLPTSTRFERLKGGGVERVFEVETHKHLSSRGVRELADAVDPHREYGVARIALFVK